MYTKFQSPKKQHGATLIIGLIMLTLLTIIGLAAMDITTVDVKIIANAKDRQLALSGAESQLNSAGQIIKDTEDDLDDTVEGYVETAYEDDGATWWSSKGNWNLTDIEGTNVQAQHQIEYPKIVRDDNDLGVCNQGPDCKWFGYYPTTTKSVGPGQAVVVLQSHYVKKLHTPPLPTN